MSLEVFDPIHALRGRYLRNCLAPTGLNPAPGCVQKRKLGEGQLATTGLDKKTDLPMLSTSGVGCLESQPQNITPFWGHRS